MAKDKDKRKAKGDPPKAKKKRSSVPATPVFTAEPVEAPADIPAPAQGLTPRRLLARMSGARLCYGKPVTGGDLTIVPVARVRVAGGFGNGPADEGQGGGGAVDATPVGYIEVGPDGARFRAIPDPDRVLKTTRSLAITAAGLLGAAAALRSFTR